MLKDEALYYHWLGKNCSQCIILACEHYYNINLGEVGEKLFITGTRGFGIGGMCNVAVACVMFFGVYYKDEKTARQAGLLFLSDFMEKMGSFDCSCLANSGGCEELICNACDIIEKIVSQMLTK